MYSSEYVPEAADIGGGHVINTVPPVWFQRERLRYFAAVEARCEVPVMFGMLRRAVYDYLAEIKPPVVVEVRTGIRRIGSSSVTYWHEAWAGDQLAVTSEAVVVLINTATGRPHPLSEPARELLRQWSVPAPD